MGFQDDIRSRLRGAGTPVTTLLVAALATAFMAIWLTQQQADLASHLIFSRATFGLQPWSLLTYPFANSPAGFIAVLFECLWLYSIGGAVERELGPVRYITLWCALTVLGAASILIGLLAMGLSGFALAGPLIPIAGLTVVWATRNPDLTVLFMFVIPLAGKWLGFIAAGIVLFDMGVGAPILGVLACVPLILAWLFATDRLPFSYSGVSGKRANWKPSERDDKYMDEVRKREKERQERERLRKLFEGSLKDEDDDRGSSAH